MEEAVLLAFKANVGDKVRVVTGDCILNVGDIVEIGGIYDGLYSVHYYTLGRFFYDGSPHVLYADEFELINEKGTIR